jgi:transcriptional regulator with XRE-family HTH domain
MNAFMKALGDELRAGRKRRGWTRRQLLNRAPFDVSLQTVATWELGTRHISAERLYQLCDLLGEPAEDLLARVRQRIQRRIPGTPAPELLLDIAAATRTTRARLAPIRAWARCRQHHQPTASAVVALDNATLNSLAQLCELTTADLTVRLTQAGLLTRPTTEHHPDTMPQPPATTNEPDTTASGDIRHSPTTRRTA